MTVIETCWSVWTGTTSPTRWGGLAVIANDGGRFTLRGYLNHSVPVSTLYDAALGDLNGDGVIDIVYMASDAGEVFRTLEVQLGDGAGGFQTPDLYDVAQGSAVRVADLNADTLDDVLILRRDGVEYRLATGNGVLGSPALLSLPGGPRTLTVGDFDGNGTADLAMPGIGGVTLIAGHGNATFAAPLTLGAVDMPRDIAQGDFDGDGRQDLAICASSRERVSLYLQ